MKIKVLRIFVLFFLIILFGCNNTEKKEKPIVEKGVLNITEWNFIKDGKLKLDGNWEYYPNQLLSPQQIDNYSDSIEYYYVPKLWNESEFKTKFGYATYRLKVKLNPKHNKKLALKILTFATNANIYINGKLIYKCGNVADNPEEAKAEYRPEVADFFADSNELNIVLQVSNFEHKKGGTWESIIIGTEKEMRKDRQRSIMFDLFLLGSILIMSLYHIGLYLLRRKDKSTLFFALVTFFVVIRIGATGEYLLGSLISFRPLIVLEYISFYLTSIAFTLFLRTLFPNEFKKFAVYIIIVPAALLTIITIVTKPAIFSHFVLFFQSIILIFGVIYFFIVLIKAARNKRVGAKTFIFGFVVLALTIINDILYNNEVIHTGNLFQTGIFVFIFSQAYLISYRFSNAFVRAEELSEKLDYQNKNLESIVKERTKEIEDKNVVLSQQKEEILAQKEELVTINDELYSVNAELEKLSIVASKTDNSVTIADKNGEIIWVNEGFERMYGMNIKEFKMKFGNNINDASTNPEISRIIENSIKEKKSAVYSVETKDLDGKEIWVQSTLTPIFSLKGELSNIIAIDSDITKIKEAEQKIAIQNENIKSSIRYAKTIQNAILPSLEFVNKQFETFILYKPKDIVSGDFYWVTHYTEKREENLTEKIFLSVVDCTGHGVPGAFMSLIGSRMLSEIVNEKNIFSPADILEELDASIRKVLKQDDTNNRDGMDLSICKIEKDFDGKRTITFAGAKRPLYYFKKTTKEIEMYRATRRSVGGFNLIHTKEHFKNEVIIPNKGDILYMTTDGYMDQNNEMRKRFGTKKFLDIIQNVATNPLREQKEVLNIRLVEWMKNTSQRDDITVVALKCR